MDVMYMVIWCICSSKLSQSIYGVRETKRMLVRIVFINIFLSHLDAFLKACGSK